MKNITLTICILFVFNLNITNSQTYFEGKITYTPSIQVYNKNLNPDSILRNLSFDKIEYYIKSGFYSTKKYKNHSLISESTYLNTDKLIYNSYSTKKNVEIISSKVYFNKKNVEFEYLNDTIIILDEPCIKLRKIKESDTTHYYISLNTFVDYSLFKSHNLGNWNERLEYCKGHLDLQFFFKEDGYDIIMTASKKEQMNLKDSFFTKISKKDFLHYEPYVDVMPKANIHDNEINKCVGEKLKINHELKDNLVIISFTIFKNGRIGDFSYKSNDEVLAKQVLSEYKKCIPKYQPGEVNNKKVNVRVSRVLKFKIE